jgi:hypothetical protein
MVASLHQARAIDHRRLSTKLGRLDDSDFDRVREGFWKLYKYIPRDWSRCRGKIPNVPSVYRLLLESQMKPCIHLALHTVGVFCQKQMSDRFLVWLAK